MIEALVSGLERGESFLIYPSGHVKWQAGGSARFGPGCGGDPRALSPSPSHPGPDQRTVGQQFQLRPDRQPART